MFCWDEKITKDNKKYMVQHLALSKNAKYVFYVHLHEPCSHFVCSFKALRACEKTSDFTVQSPRLIRGVIFMLHEYSETLMIHSFYISFECGH